MSFTSKRGRPSKENPKLKLIEGGKKEPQPTPKKPFVKTTREPIDICAEKGLIKPMEHKAAIHFRWLYTIKFGAPTVSAIDYEKIAGAFYKINDPAWQEARERDYAMAVEKLRKIGALKIVLNIAIFGSFPSFLDIYRRNRNNFGNFQELQKLREGLDLLAKLWEKNQKNVFK